MLLAFGAFLLFAAWPLGGTTVAVWLLAVSQLCFFLNEARKGQVTGSGAFLFMSFLFFGMRPVYLVLERDYSLFHKVFLIRPDMPFINYGMWWATLAALFFAVGAQLPRRIQAATWNRRVAASRVGAARPAVRSATALVLLAGQLATLPAVYWLATRAGRGLYESGLGAYAYDAPVPMQAVHIFAIVVLVERYLRAKSAVNLATLIVSAGAFMAFTWLMRDVSNFRGFYLTGIMIAGLAVLQRLKPRVGYAWLIVPILVVQPFFKYLGERRSLENAELLETDVAEEIFQDEGVVMAYWRFYEARGGDMNIFDTFAAATKAEPSYYPYALSWLYVPFHFVPRFIWEDKPKRGVLVDMKFTRGAPLSPGIAGFFLLDGGFAWMLLSMLVLGYLIAMLDCYVLTMRPGYLQSCLVGIVVVNAMFLTRFFLWQYFYQMLYAAIPCFVLAWYLNRRSRPTLTGSPMPARRYRGKITPRLGV
jgi:hypothetical protein